MGPMNHRPFTSLRIRRSSHGARGVSSPRANAARLSRAFPRCLRGKGPGLLTGSHAACVANVPCLSAGWRAISRSPTRPILLDVATFEHAAVPDLPRRGASRISLELTASSAGRMDSGSTTINSNAEVRSSARGVLLDACHLASAVRTRTDETADDAALVPGIPHTGIGVVPIRDVLIEDPDCRVGAHDFYSRETTSIQLSTLALQVLSQGGTQPVAAELAP